MRRPGDDRHLPGEPPHHRAPARSAEPALGAEWLQVAVQVDPERVVEHVGREHQRAEGGQGHDLLGREVAGQIGVHLIGHAVGVPAHLAAVLHDGTLLVVEVQSIGILARLDQQAAEERRADEAVGLGRDGVGEEMRETLSEERLDRVAQRVPGHQRVERRQRAQQGALHVGDPADVLLVLIVRGPGFGRGVIVVERWDASHGIPKRVDGGLPKARGRRGRIARSNTLLRIAPDQKDG